VTELIGSGAIDMGAKVTCARVQREPRELTSRMRSPSLAGHGAPHLVYFSTPLFTANHRHTKVHTIAGKARGFPVKSIGTLSKLRAEELTPPAEADLSLPHLAVDEVGPTTLATTAG
jgi:hypothetical protein